MAAGYLTGYEISDGGTEFYDGTDPLDAPRIKKC